MVFSFFFFIGCSEGGALRVVGETNKDAAESDKQEDPSDDPAEPTAEPTSQENDPAEQAEDPAGTEPDDFEQDDYDPSYPDPSDDPADPDAQDEDPAVCTSDPVFCLGQYFVNVSDVLSKNTDTPRDFRIFEPAGAEGPLPVIHFLHGFMYKMSYYDNFLIHLASHGFIVVSSQSDHGLAGVGGDNSKEEAQEVLSFINWLKQNLQERLTVTADFDNFGVSGHSRGGKVTNRVLNSDPTVAKSFFGVDPVDSKPPLSGSDSESLNDPVQFTGESMFLGTEKGPSGLGGIGNTAACAPEDDNSVHFYAAYPSPSHHIIAAGVGHADMVDPEDVSGCGTYCSACKGSGDSGMNLMFISYTGGLMTAFFKSTLKGETQYEALLNDSSTHPFMTTVVEHK